MTYTTINKSEIPPIPKQNHERFGEWISLARHMVLLPADKAFCIELGGMRINTASVSLHTACKRVGVKVSTTVIAGCMYVVRTGYQEPVGDPPRHFVCDACNGDGVAVMPNQKYHSSKRCQEIRRSRNLKAMKEKRKAA